MSAFDIREADTPHSVGRQRCSSCGTYRLLEGDGQCFGCLTFRAVPVKAHQPAPRWMVTGYIDGAEVFREPFATARAVDHVRELYGAENVKIEVIG
jgi:hypothetical protein